MKLGGHECHAVGDGPAALAEVAEGWPELVLLDISMPGMDGLEVLTHIRETHSIDRLPVFMLTALSDETVRARAASLGADGYFVKGDYDLSDFLAALDARLAVRSN